MTGLSGRRPSARVRRFADAGWAQDTVIAVAPGERLWMESLGGPGAGGCHPPLQHEECPALELPRLGAPGSLALTRGAHPLPRQGCSVCGGGGSALGLRLPTHRLGMGGARPQSVWSLDTLRPADRSLMGR